MPLLLLRFCLIGSVIGGGAFVVARGLASGEATSRGANAVFALVAGIPLWGLLSSFLSVPLGFFPSALAAMVYWLALRNWTSENPRPLARALLGGGIGAIVGSTFGGLLFSAGSATSSYPFKVNLLAWGVAGVVGGATSALASGQGTYAALWRNVQREV